MVFLVGYMGAGKSSVANALSKQLSWPTVDLDHFIEKKYDKSIVSFFADEGEAYFRQIESACLRELPRIYSNKTLVATGGGAACFHANMQFMLSQGQVIYLSASVATLVERLQKQPQHDRPTLRNAKTKEALYMHVTDHLNSRRPFYEQAHIQVNAEQSIEQLVSEIIYRITYNAYTKPGK